ncbi:hypothetical protein [Spongiivirga citrea]|uniref:HEPN AbiU2-like domain-containing protein n=1 Tax=Spongiivirga citrea TaxID=1481457 RepID=A0A6M0CYG5_9FLAO|nr:hypothetical protein [Spongiivirga citrea]NER18760.1 hypothetical protein [Spongiivirga citrea]
MANFDQHIIQAKRNIKFLDSVDNSIPDFWDWKVTTVFYVGVHLMNAHLAKTLGYTYRTHREVEQAINCNNTTSLGKVDETTYLAYTKLRNLSRRSRYLIHHSDKNSQVACMTYDKHFSKSLTHLEDLIKFVEEEYDVVIPKIGIDCIEISKKKLPHFEYERMAVSIGDK